tara:strand:+ start:330 stop:488 length:159 start_codon:yes stop_codon:yes gene_type:complete
MNNKCSHHWEIAPASGKESPGTCKLCGAKKMFKNSLEQPDKPRVHINIRDWD